MAVVAGLSTTLNVLTMSPRVFQQIGETSGATLTMDSGGDGKADTIKALTPRGSKTGESDDAANALAASTALESPRGNGEAAPSSPQLDVVAASMDVPYPTLPRPVASPRKSGASRSGSYDAASAADLVKQAESLTMDRVESQMRI